MKLYVQEASMWSGTNEHRGPQCIILTRTTQAFGASNNNQIRILSNYISARWMADTLFSGPPRFSPPGCYHPLYIHNLLFPLSAAFDVNQNCQNIRTTFLSICLFLFFSLSFLRFHKPDNFQFWLIETTKPFFLTLTVMFFVPRAIQWFITANFVVIYWQQTATFFVNVQPLYDNDCMSMLSRCVETEQESLILFVLSMLQLF